MENENLTTMEEANEVSEMTENNEETGSNVAGVILVGMAGLAITGAVLGTKLIIDKGVKPLVKRWKTRKAADSVVTDDSEFVDAEEVENFADEIDK